MKREYFEAFVKGVGFDNDEDPILFLKTNSGKVLSLPVGAFEASAIIIKAEGIDPPHPLTHDILSDFIRVHKFKVLKLEIYGRTNFIYFARLVYRKGLRKYKMNLRPCDGIALALRTGASIMVNRHLLDINENITPSLSHYTGADAVINYLDLEKSNTNYI